MAKRRTARGIRFVWFDSPVGRCALSWTDAGVTCVQLPERTVKETLSRLTQRHGEPVEQLDAPPAAVRKMIDKLVRHLEGKSVDLSSIPLDYAGVPPFHAKVYKAARQVPAGATVSYGQLARAAGSPAASRAVGQAMARNPFPLVVPCHRVLGADGSAVGFSAHGGCGLKEKLLKLEGADVPETFERQFDLQKNRTGSNPRTTAIARARPKPAADVCKSAKAGIAHICKVDPKMAKLIEQVGGFKLEIRHGWSPLEALARSIVYQQLTGKPAATIYGRVLALYGGELGAPAQILRTPDEDLRGAGLSRSKVAAFKDLAEKAQEGLIPDLETLEQMDSEEIIERLTAVRGIGRWTVEMMLIFRLGRPDVLPITDYGVQKGFAVAFNRKGKLPTPKELAAHGERWSPYRSIAAWYLWRANEL